MFTWIKILFLCLFFSIFVGAGIHIACLKQRHAKRVLEVFLLWTFGIAGVIGLVKFYGLIFEPDAYAHFLGWEPKTAWQEATAIANLIIGALGLLSIWIRGSFWTATVIALTIRDWGTTIGHYIQLIRHYDFAMGNIGIFVYLEIIHPIIAITLYIAYCNVKKIPQKL